MTQHNMSTPILDGEKVNDLFRDCLFKKGEDTSNYVKAEGILCTVGFHPGRLESYRAEISAMLDELPGEFRQAGGGGMSFLKACFDKHGNQWTNTHQRMDQLFQLGTAIGRVTCLAPREIWGALPSGMPYYLVTD